MKPILFNTEMVRAILEGRKTVTRRVVKFLDGKNPNWTGYVKDGLTLYNGTNEPCNKPAPYQVNDILYVRETWQCWRAHRYEATADIRFKAEGNGVRLQFANGNTDSINRDDYDRFIHKWFSHNGEWKPSIHMPKEAARIFLRVTDVRVERLQDITAGEIRKEGLLSMAVHAGDYEIAVKEWELLWDSTVKQSDVDSYCWNANPYVWVIEFERLECSSMAEVLKQMESERMNKERLMWYRFKTKSVDDFRPLIDMKEIQMPWWCTAIASDKSYAIIVCFLPKGEDLYKYWDDAYDVESDERTGITYTDRFPKPSWISKGE